MKDAYYNQIKWHIVALVHKYNEMLTDYDTTHNELENVDNELEIAVKDFNGDAKLTHQYGIQFPCCEIKTDARGRKHYYFEWKYF